jgi:hypothetical protein
MRAWVLSTLLPLALAACAAKAPTAQPGDADALAADAAVACARLSRRDAGMWTQIVFATETWNALARRADSLSDYEDNIDARAEMVALMKRYRPAACTPDVISGMEEGIRTMKASRDRQ